MTDVAAVVGSDQACDDAMMKVEDMMNKLKTRNLALYGELVLEKTAHALAMKGSVRLRRNMKKAVAKKEEAMWLCAEKIAKRENSAVV